MNIPLLEESELEQIPKQWLELGKLLEDAKQYKDSTLHQLLHPAEAIRVPSGLKAIDKTVA